MSEYGGGWWGTIADWGGTALDWLGENEWLVDGVTRLAMDHPEMDYDKLMEMAMQEATINSPDVFSPTGSVTWDIDEETGKRTATQKYSPQVQGLFDMLVRNAGTPTDTYAAPQGMQNLLGQYLQDRGQHMGVDMPAYEQWTASPNLGAMFSGYDSDEDEESEHSSPSGGRFGGSVGSGREIGAGGPGGTTRRDGGGVGTGRDLSTDQMDLIRGLVSRGIGGSQGGNFNVNDWLDDLFDSGDVTHDSEVGLWLAENADHIGGLVGRYAGIPGLGLITDWGMNNLFWDNHSFQSPWENPNDSVVDGIFEGAVNAPGDGQQSPIGEGSRGVPGYAGSIGGPNAIGADASNWGGDLRSYLAMMLDKRRRKGSNDGNTKRP